MGKKLFKFYSIFSKFFQGVSIEIWLQLSDASLNSSLFSLIQKCNNIFKNFSLTLFLCPRKWRVLWNYLSVCRFVDFFGNLSLVFCHFCIMIDNCKIKKLTEFFFFLKWSKQVHNGQKGVLIFFF